eukprot:618718-Prorocentrum_minimum.AAC.1
MLHRNESEDCIYLRAKRALALIHLCSLVLNESQKQPTHLPHHAHCSLTARLRVVPCVSCFTCYLLPVTCFRRLTVPSAVLPTPHSRRSSGISA